MSLIPWNRPRGALHSLAHWLEIDEGASCVLLLSERTLYLLQNLAALDLAMSARYIADETELGYYPPEPESEDWETFVAAYELAQRELAQPMQHIYGIQYTTVADRTLITTTSGTVVLDPIGPEEGEVWEVESLELYRDTNAANVKLIESITPLTAATLVYDSAGVALSIWDKRIVLTYPNYLKATFLGCTVGERILCRAHVAVLNPQGS